MKQLICIIPFVVTVLTQNIPTVPIEINNTAGKAATENSPVWNADDITSEQTSLQNPEISDPFLQNLEGTSERSPLRCGGSRTDCVPYYLCNNSQISNSGFGLIDIAGGNNSTCSGSLDVCCSVANKRSAPLIHIPKLTSQECGFRNIDGVGFRITGDRDNETQFGEFPWMIAVLEKTQHSDGEHNLYLCGGSLIHPRVVLTAAHCIAKKPNNILKIRAGEWDTQTISEPLPYQDRDIVEVRIHENYQSRVLRNDIALMFLASAVKIAENVKTVCLPPVDQTFDYTRCYATGWGKDKYGIDGKYQVILKKIDLPIIPNDKCQEMLRSTRLSQHFELHESFVCAGGEINKDTCKGDGGSPLVCPISGAKHRYYQAGIVLWGIGCGESNIPGVYANVALFRSWLDKQFKEKRFDQSSYNFI